MFSSYVAVAKLLLWKYLKKMITNFMLRFVLFFQQFYKRVTLSRIKLYKMSYPRDKKISCIAGIDPLFYSVDDWVDLIPLSNFVFIKKTSCQVVILSKSVILMFFLIKIRNRYYLKEDKSGRRSFRSNRF